MNKPPFIVTLGSVLALILTPSSCVAQDDGPLMINPDIPPEFPGGEGDLYCFIDEHINKELVRQTKATGSSLVEFTIDTTGHISNIHIIKPLDRSIDDELVRIVCLMPVWSPASRYGRLQEVRYVLPLRIPYSSSLCDRTR